MGTAMAAGGVAVAAAPGTARCLGHGRLAASVQRHEGSGALWPASRLLRRRPMPRPQLRRPGPLDECNPAATARKGASAALHVVRSE